MELQRDAALTLRQPMGEDVGDLAHHVDDGHHERAMTTAKASHELATIIQVVNKHLHPKAFFVGHSRCDA